MLTITKAITQTVGLSVLLVSPALAENYSPAKVVAAMKVYDSQLKIIAEHRGRFYQGCAENSVCSITATSQEGVEAVEIDVRESADGTLWPIHDTNLGRVTNYSLNGHLFSPYDTSAENEKNNPEVDRMHDAALERLKLRDPTGAVTNEDFRPLASMIRAADIGNRNIVYIFDIKTASAITKTATMIDQLGIQDRSVLKFNSTLVQPDQVFNITKGNHFVPVLGTGSLDYIVEHYHLEKRTPTERVEAYAADLYKTFGFVYFEIRNKMFKETGTGLVVDGPLYNTDAYLKLSDISLGGYAPSVEHFSAPGQMGTGYYSLDGHCCGALTARMDSSRYFGNDTRDDRENLKYMVSFNNVIISEHAGAALAEARRIGARNKQSSLYY